MTRGVPTALAGVAIVLCAVTAGGCGYSLRGTLPTHLKTVGVPIFSNLTSEPAIDGFLTRAVVEAFSTNGRLRVVRPEDADAVLTGSIVGFDVSPIAFDPSANIVLYRVTITMNLSFRDARANALLWQQIGLTEKSDFRVAGQVSQTIGREQVVVQQAAVEIARNIVTLAVDRF